MATRVIIALYLLIPIVFCLLLLSDAGRAEMRQTGQMTDLVTPVPTTGVLAWHPWSSTSGSGVTSYCVSSGSAEPFPPITR